MEGADGLGADGLGPVKLCKPRVHFTGRSNENVVEMLSLKMMLCLQCCCCCCFSGKLVLCRYPACYAALNPVELPVLKVAEHKFCLGPQRPEQCIRTMEPSGRLCQNQTQRKQLCQTWSTCKHMRCSQTSDDAQKWPHDWRAAGRGQPGLLTRPVRPVSVDNRPPRFNSAINTAGV